MAGGASLLPWRPSSSMGHDLLLLLVVSVLLLVPPLAPLVAHFVPLLKKMDTYSYADGRRREGGKTRQFEITVVAVLYLSREVCHFSLLFLLTRRLIHIYIYQSPRLWDSRSSDEPLL